MGAESFRELVKGKVAAIVDRSHREVEAELARKRSSWARERLAAIEAARGEPLEATPRAAFELFIRDYLGADLETVPVVHETDREIAWHAQNRCDTLEACGELGLDTRVVCRARYDKPVQHLLSALDPELRFVRNYERVRPMADVCEERIVRVSFDAWMDRAIEQAREARPDGRGGYGAVVARGSEVVAATHDTASSSGDPSDHAATRALRQAAKQLGDANLCGCVLVSTCEPCPMCAALAVWANVTTIVYGAAIDETAALGRSRIRISAAELVDRSPATVEVLGGCRRERCLDLYR
ncbi:MAG: nucleoside deaminase [Deltaproteobacteria bacterium]|jgi:tRNA(Arg) A34 adenosine deaminase TadA|nr:nucleoside deaminase [Deltaproteobacteria bacterium]MBW2534694.1 nucleoside deaminase [Deltaproteobacteria bacterium]